MKRQELVIWPCTDELVCEPLVVEAIVKRGDQQGQHGNRTRGRWAWAIRGKIEQVKPLEAKEEEFCRLLVFDDNVGDLVNVKDEKDIQKKGMISPSFHTRCGEGWERFYWIVYPVARDSHVMSIDSVSLACERMSYGEDELRVGLFYMNTVEMHHHLIQANSMSMNYLFFHLFTSNTSKLIHSTSS